MNIDPGNAPINDNFGKGTNDNIGKKDFMFGQSSGFGDKNSTGKSSLNSLYEQARQRKSENMARINANDLSKNSPQNLPDKSVKGALESTQVIGARKFIGEVMKSMEKNDANKYFCHGETYKEKFRVAQELAQQIKGGKVGTGSYFRKTEVRRSGNDFLSGKKSLGKKDIYASAPAKKAVAKVLGEITGDKYLKDRSNRT